MSYDPFEIIKDSSIWYSSQQFSAVEKKDPQIRIGIIKEVYVDKATSDLRYLVEMRDKNDAILLNCRMMRKFGGAYNYEDVILRGYKTDDKPDNIAAFDAKAGDAVIVAALNGEMREGIILGGLTHSARTLSIPIDKGPYYKSEFNGIETSINDDGEYTLIFKAQPTNVNQLKDTPSHRIENPKYDDNIGGTFLKFDKTGSFEVNDRAKKDLQQIRIDKPEGFIVVNSGKISLKLTKKTEQVDLKSKILNITSDDNINIKTKQYKTEASEFFSVKSPKVALGKEGIELLDQLSKLVDALGKVKPISPLGPCTALIATPEWPDVANVQAKIKEITGSL